MASIMNIVNKKQTFSCKCFRDKWSLNCQFSRWACSRVWFDLYKLTSAFKIYPFNQIRIEHKGSLQNAYNHQINFSLFLGNVSIVSIDLSCNFFDHIVDILLTVEKSKRKTIMRNYLCHCKYKYFIDLFLIQQLTSFMLLILLILR